MHNPKLMSDQTDILTRTLARFGLTGEESRIYLHLLEKGPSSALKISREIHMARTKVYRLLDKIERQGLVTKKFDTMGLKFSASPYSQLELLVAQKQSDVDALRQAMPAIFTQLAGLMGKQDHQSKVHYHHGIDGLKHVTWNSLRANTLRIYEVSESMTAFLPQEFSEKVREEFGRRKTKILQLTNLTHIASHTMVEDTVRHWNVRHIPTKELTIASEVLIYNDITTIYHYQRNDIFCVEIENADLARMQTQLFEFIWRHATPMKKIGKRGEARL